MFGLVARDTAVENDRSGAASMIWSCLMSTTGVLNMIMMSFISIPLVTVAWLLAGYTLAFSGGGSLIGNLDHLGMMGIGSASC